MIQLTKGAWRGLCGSRAKRQHQQEHGDDRAQARMDIPIHLVLLSLLNPTSPDRMPNRSTASLRATIQAITNSLPMSNDSANCPHPILATVGRHSSASNCPRWRGIAFTL